MPDDAELLRQYLDLITSEHVQKPRFRATVGLSILPYIASLNEACRIIGLYDLDTATGQALDFTGQWIGLSRFIHLPADLWFSFDVPNLGFDRGRWMVPFEQEFNIIRLDDEDYRNLLRAKVLANYWDGTIPGAYRAWDQLFGPSGYKLVIQDQGARPEPNTHGNMHIWQILFGPPMSNVTKFFFQAGFLGLKSAGVGSGYLSQSQPPGFDGTDRPLFAFDTEELPPLPYDQSIWDDGESIWDDGDSEWDLTGTISVYYTYPPIMFAGFDQGGWARVLPPLPEQR